MRFVPPFAVIHTIRMALPCFFLFSAVAGRAQDFPLPPLPNEVPPAGEANIDLTPDSTAESTLPTTKLTADKVRYENGIIVAEADTNPVRLESETVRVTAQTIRIDVQNRRVKAEGEVLVERDIIANRRALQSRVLRDRTSSEAYTETLRGDNFEYDFVAQTGRLDTVEIRLESFDIEAQSLTVNGTVYLARNVVMRPGGLTDEERRIYGTPPFNLRVSKLTLDTGNEDQPPSIAASGAGLYFKNTKILPVPSYVFRLIRPGGAREDKAFTLSPRIATNSADGVLLTTQLAFPFNRTDPDKLLLEADLGLSARVGFRGGVQFNARTDYGTFGLAGRLNDIVTTQLTNRIELDRKPELTFISPVVPLFDLPGGRRAGIYLSAGTGRFTERQTGIGGTDVSSTRHQAQIGFTTRTVDVDGPYLDLFARTSSYSALATNYRNAGFEVGYIGPLTNYVRGQFSYTNISLAGNTPFRFDRIEIARELRTTFDVQVSPRYIVPIDLRYDLDLQDFRDERIGLLRSYKTFAYGVTYQTSRRELKLDFRRGF